MKKRAKSSPMKNDGLRKNSGGKFVVHQHPPEKLMEQMSQAFASWARTGLKDEPFLLVGLAGGRSLDGLFERTRAQLPTPLWRRIFFFPVDERIVSSLDRENNAHHLREKTLRPLLYSCDIKPANVLSLDTKKMMKKKKSGGRAGQEGGNKRPDELAAYSHALHTLRPHGADLLILGIGADGHVASLFPKRAELKEKGMDWLLVKKAPKPPPIRATLPPDAIRAASALWLVARGEEKRTALEKLLAARGTIANCPARLSRENRNGATVWTDLE
jgi:6-phosphogluconolactonase